MTNEHSAERASRQHHIAAIIVWTCAIAMLVFLRYRGEIGLYQEFHKWMAEQGVAHWVRNMDSELLLILLGLVLCLLMRAVGKGKTQGFLSDLGLHRGLVKGATVGLVICTPILALGIVRGFMLDDVPFFDFEMIHLGLTAPFAEELLFRGVLVLAIVRLVGTRFWTAAVVGALLFGAMHLQWTVEGVRGGWPIVLVTGAGGVWYAWLARQWSRNLFVPIIVHMLMNLAAPWYGGTENAMGDPFFETGRAATIALGTIMTINPALFKMTWARHER